MKDYFVVRDSFGSRGSFFKNIKYQDIDSPSRKTPSKNYRLKFDGVSGKAVDTKKNFWKKHFLKLDNSESFEDVLNGVLGASHSRKSYFWNLTGSSLPWNATPLFSHISPLKC